MLTWFHRACLLTVALAAALAAAETDAGPLAIGQARDLEIGGGELVSLNVAVDAAGILTVVTRGAKDQDADLVLLIMDADNQPLRGGQADVDANENPVCEQVVVEIPWAETWKVKIGNNGGDTAKVKLVASFAALAEVAREPDIDGRPSKAKAIEIGQVVEDTLSAVDYDVADWYQIVAEADGRLSVFSAGDEALDLALNVTTGEKFDEAVGDADNDLNGETANEGLVIPVKAGQTYYIQVMALVDSGGKYRLGTQFTQF